MSPRPWSRWAIAAVAVAGLLVPAVIHAVYVSPTAVFMDDRHRNAQVTLGNSSDVPEEVRIELKFGFLDTDSAGTPFIRIIEDPGPDFPSATGWLGVFPQRARLEPGEKRVVRLFARPPADLPDGEYWSRLIVTSRRAPSPLAPGDTLARAGVSLEIRLVTSVTFRKGQVSTALTLRDLTAAAGGDSLVLRLGMDRGGNAAYLGTMQVELVDPQGGVARQWATPIAVHVPIHRRFVFPLEGLTPGTYLLRLLTEAKRDDVAEGGVLPAPPVVDSLTVTVG
jgi:hypothetical protein